MRFAASPASIFSPTMFVVATRARGESRCRDRRSALARCSFAARGRVCSMHEEERKKEDEEKERERRRPSPPVIAVETGWSADRSHDLSFPFFSGPPPPAVRLSSPLLSVPPLLLAFISRLIPGNEVANYVPTDRSRLLGQVSKLHRCASLHGERKNEREIGRWAHVRSFRLFSSHTCATMHGNL